MFPNKKFSNKMMFDISFTLKHPFKGIVTKFDNPAFKRPAVKKLDTNTPTNNNAKYNNADTVEMTGSDPLSAYPLPEKAMEALKEAFQPALAAFLSSNTIAELAAGTLKIEQYRAILREMFHQVREHPQMLMQAASKLRGRDREMVKAFFNHASSEVGHDQLALNDYVTLGGDASAVPYQYPLPATSALLAFGYYQIHEANPIGYLGYLFFLEFAPTATGTGLMQQLETIGVPRTAMTFIGDHAEIDVHHNRLMERYALQLLHTQANLEAVAHVMETTATLYGRMMDDAAADALSPGIKRWNWTELEADGLTPESVHKRRVA